MKNKNIVWQRSGKVERLKASRREDNSRIKEIMDNELQFEMAVFEVTHVNRGCVNITTIPYLLAKIVE